MAANRPMERSAAAFRAAHAAASPLVTPLAHDALSARLIAAAGFPAFNIGGSSLLAARYALPDLGLAALGEMVDAIRDVVDAVELPCMADADDGYGDAKSVARTVRSYERIGVAGLLLEDQGREGKQPGAAAARSVVPVPVMVAKLQAALDAREVDMVVIARTDALGVEGLDGAIRRAERYLRTGADGVFVAGLTQVAQYEQVGAAFRGSWNAAAMFEGGATPWLTPAELRRLGFSQISYPTSLILRVTGVIQQALSGLRTLAAGEASPMPGEGLLSPKGFRQALAMDQWTAIEAKAARDAAGVEDER